MQEYIKPKITIKKRRALTAQEEEKLELYISLEVRLAIGIGLSKANNDIAGVLELEESQKKVKGLIADMNLFPEINISEI